MKKKLLTLIVSLASLARAQDVTTGNASSLQGMRVKFPLTCSDGYAVTWAAANNRFECLAPGGAGSTSMPRAGLVTEYLLDDSYGGYARNAVFPNQANYNLIGPSEQGFAAAPWGPILSTATDGYGVNPSGDFTASRLQMNASAGGYLNTLSQYPYAAGRQYTLSIWVKSNTGSAQAVRMSDDALNYTSDLAVSAAWTRISNTFTPAGTGYVLPIKQDAAGDAIDILIWGAQLETGPHPTTYIAQNYHMTLGGGPQLTTKQPAWVATGADFTAHSGASYASAIGSAPINLAALSMYAVFQWTGTEVLSGYAPLFSDPYSAGKLFLAGENSSASKYPQFKFNGSAALGYAATLNDGVWHVLTGTYDGTTLRVYLDDAEIGSKSASISPIQVSQLFLSNFNDVAFWPGTIGYAALYNVGHSASTVLSNVAILQRLMASRGVTMTNLSKFLAFEGDSITDPADNVNGASKYYYTAFTSLSPVVQGRNFAITGSTVADLTSRASSVDAVYKASRTKNVEVVLIGANDLLGGAAATFVANLKTYCLARKATGWQVVVLTVTPRTNSGFNATRNAANTLIRADPSFYDALADVAADVDVGCDACASNTTFYSDGTHPTPAGHAKIAPYVISALQSLL
jgi:lysophospholipase L1-like esterase